MVKPTFSERHGFAPQAVPITIGQDAPAELRGLIPRLAYDCGFKPETLRPLVCSVALRAQDTGNWSEPNIEAEVRVVLDQCDWFEVYEIVWAIAARLEEWDGNLSDEDGRLDVFTLRINRALRQHGIGWQLINGRVEVRGGEVFETVA